MTIDEMISALEAMKKVSGGDAVVPFMSTWGENDYVIPDYPVIGDFEDQDGNTFRCAFICNEGGEEFSEKGVPHFSWNPNKLKINY